MHILTFDLNLDSGRRTIIKILYIHNELMGHSILLTEQSWTCLQMLSTVKAFQVITPGTIPLSLNVLFHLLVYPRVHLYRVIIFISQGT